MSERADKLLWCPPAIVRLCVIFGFAAFFFTASMLVRPQRSQASFGTATSAATATQASTPSDKTDALLNPNAVHGSPARPSSPSPVATYPRAASPVDATKPPIADDQGNLLLGVLVGTSDNIIWVYSGAMGPLYSVVHKTRGVLAYSLEADDLYRQFPDCDLTKLKMIEMDRNTGTIMLADPERERLP